MNPESYAPRKILGRGLALHDHQLIACIQTFINDTGVTARSLGMQVWGNPTIVPSMLSGRRHVSHKTANELLEWMKLYLEYRKQNVELLRTLVALIRPADSA